MRLIFAAGRGGGFSRDVARGLLLEALAYLFREALHGVNEFPDKVFGPQKTPRLDEFYARILGQLVRVRQNRIPRRIARFDSNQSTHRSRRKFGDGTVRLKRHNGPFAIAELGATKRAPLDDATTHVESDTCNVG